MNNETFTATLHFGDIYDTQFHDAWTASYRLTECEIISYVKDNINVPIDDPIYGVRVKMLTPDINDFIEWYSTHDVRTGRIIVTLAEVEGEVYKTFDFIDAQLIRLSDSYEVNKKRHTELLFVMRKFSHPTMQQLSSRPGVRPQIASHASVDVRMLIGNINSDVQYDYNNLIYVSKYDIHVGQSLAEFFAEDRINRTLYTNITLRNQMSESLRTTLYMTHRKSVPITLSIIIEPKHNGNHLLEPELAYIIDGYIVEMHEHFSTASSQHGHFPIEIKVLVNEIHAIGNGHNSEIFKTL